MPQQLFPHLSLTHKLNCCCYVLFLSSRHVIPGVNRAEIVIIKEPILAEMLPLDSILGGFNALTGPEMSDNLKASKDKDMNVDIGNISPHHQQCSTLICTSDFCSYF